MKKEMLINVLQPEECRIAILEDGVLEELYVERTSHESYVGNIYKGRIVNIEPSIQAAFVDFGVGRNGFLHVSDVEPAYYRHLEGFRDRDRNRDRDRDGGRDGGRGRRRDGGGGRGGRGGRGERTRRPDAYYEEEFGAEFDDDTSLTGAPLTLDQVTPSEEIPIVDEAVDLPTGDADPLVPEALARAEAEPESGEGQEPREEPGRAEPGPEGEEPRRRRGRGRGRGRRSRGGERGERGERPAERERGGHEGTPADAAPPGEPADRPSDHIDLDNPPEPPKPRLMDSAEHRTQPGEEGPGPIEPRSTYPDEELSFSLPRPVGGERATAEHEPHHREEEELVEPAPVPDEYADADEGAVEEDLRAEPPPSDLDDDYVPGDEVPRPFEEQEDEGRPYRRPSPRDDRRDNRGRDDRGRDDRRGGPRRGGRRPMMGRPGFGRPKPLIQDIFRKGQEVLVQVIKEGIGTKGPTLSTYISIAGRYLVLMPGLNRIGVSRKIIDEEQRRRLKEILHQLQPPKGLGFIIRTAGLDRSKVELQNDLTYLAKLWKVVAGRIKKRKSPCLLYEESDMITRTIRDTFTSEIDTVWVDEKNAFEHAQEFMQIVMDEYARRIKLYEGPEPMFHKYGIENEIARIQMRHVPLPNGGSIVIDQTEALVAIDVNSGNFRADNNAEETAYQMNLLAAKEIARQLRLRDLGGVIVNDFIDMREERHRRGVERAMREAVQRDRARTKILRISQFGIIEMTRQRIRPSLKRSVYQDCPHCIGTGQVKTTESMSIDVMRLIQLAAHRPGIHRIQVKVHGDVSTYLLNRKRREIARLEEAGEIVVGVIVAHDVSPEFMEFVCYDNNNNEVKFLPYEEPRPARRRG